MIFVGSAGARYDGDCLRDPLAGVEDDLALLPAAPRPARTGRLDADPAAHQPIPSSRKSMNDRRRRLVRVDAAELAAVEDERLALRRRGTRRRGR